MITIRVKLDTIEKIKEFVSAIQHFPYDFNISTESGKYIVDAKSIMGVLSLDLSKNLNLSINVDKDTYDRQIKDEIEKFTID